MYGILESIDTIVRKLNTDYKPLSVAVFLVIAGMIFGSFFVQKTGVVKQQVAITGSTFITKAQGAEIDSAALTVADAPFLASVNTGAGSTSSVQNLSAFYNDGAMKDPGSAR